MIDAPPCQALSSLFTSMVELGFDVALASEWPEQEAKPPRRRAAPSWELPPIGSFAMPNCPCTIQTTRPKLEIPKVGTIEKQDLHVVEMDPLVPWRPGFVPRRCRF
ncbi:hypothetical protein M440DRAFT_142243 [Trichoderma longibrachiatum ATCC 18648]|uniref:Uncharacterized protein n=1 Tax=Trichoderma longibrachiatum ATCC 18648 TaxID=983965 RepID=A0A2T4BUX6_TRILO|nr:hypothetical protein M440DRAFT_142243 [Trichoderma longibrachiatum ATCC 18648]